VHHFFAGEGVQGAVDGDGIGPFRQAGEDLRTSTAVGGRQQFQHTEPNRRATQADFFSNFSASMPRVSWSE